MAKTTQLTLTLESRSGVLARISRLLADAGVNITALCAAETTGRGKIRMVVTNPARAKAALKAAKLRYGEERALALTLRNRPGALARVTGKLAKGRVNIKCAYATTTRAGSARVILSVSNPDKARAILGR